MKKIISLMAVVALASVSTLSAAQGYYIFGNIGESDVDSGFNSVPGIDADEKDTTFNIGVGYKVNDYFSVETGYVDLGKARAKTTAPISGSSYGSTYSLDGKLDVDVKGYFIGIKGEKDITGKFSLFAKTGLLVWVTGVSLSGTVTIDGESYSDSDSDVLAYGADPYVSLGAAYVVNEKVSIDFQVSRYLLDYDGDDVDIDTITLGATYHF